jgi:hypothetical protein
MKGKLVGAAAAAILAAVPVVASAAQADYFNGTLTAPNNREAIGGFRTGITVNGAFRTSASGSPALRVAFYRTNGTRVDLTGASGDGTAGVIWQGAAQPSSRPSCRLLNGSGSWPIRCYVNF